MTDVPGGEEETCKQMTKSDPDNGKKMIAQLRTEAQAKKKPCRGTLRNR